MENKDSNQEGEIKDYDPEVQEWSFFMSGHELRWDIYILLKIFYELNATKMSKYLERSRSTISRQLNKMEERGILVSRMDKSAREGVITPKLFRINEKMFKDLGDSEVVKLLGIWDLPEKTKDRRKYYQNVIQDYRMSIENYRNTLNSLNYLVDYFEENLNDIKRADDIFNQYFTKTDSNLPLEPLFYAGWFDDKAYEKFLILYNKFLKSVWEIKQDLELNSERIKKGRAFAYYSTIFSIKSVFEANKEKLKKKRKGKLK
jgi:hypothetical protein